MVSTWSRGIYTILQGTGLRGRSPASTLKITSSSQQLGPPLPAPALGTASSPLPLHSKAMRQSPFWVGGQPPPLPHPSPPLPQTLVPTPLSTKCACRLLLYVKWLRRQSLAARAMAVGGGGDLVKEMGHSLASFLPQLSAPSCVSMSTRQMGHFLLMASHWSTHSWWKRCIQGRRLEKRRVR